MKNRTWRSWASALLLAGLAWAPASCAKSTKPKASLVCLEYCEAAYAACQGANQGTGGCEAEYDSCRVACAR
jgi:hypothetical protein